MFKLYLILKNNKKYTNELKYIESRRNGVFLYSYLPFFFKIYHFENVFPNFLDKLKYRSSYYFSFYKYIIQLYDEIMVSLMKEEKEKKEVNEDSCAVVMFLWSVIVKEIKEKEINSLMNSTVKMLEWIGRIEEEKEEMKRRIKKNNKEKTRRRIKNMNKEYE